jgi:hypothetical protein
MQDNIFFKRIYFPPPKVRVLTQPCVCGNSPYLTLQNIETLGFYASLIVYLLRNGIFFLRFTGGKRKVMIKNVNTNIIELFLARNGRMDGKRSKNTLTDLEFDISKVGNDSLSWMVVTKLYRDL